MRNVLTSAACIALGTLMSLSVNAGGIDKPSHGGHKVGKWYVRADVGQTAWHNYNGVISNQINTGNTDMWPQWQMDKKTQFGVGVGRCLPFHLRTDLLMQRTGMSSMMSRNTAIRSIGYGDLYGSVQSTSTFLNFYWDLKGYSHLLSRWGVNPYLGVGAGLAQNKMGAITEMSQGTQNIVAHIPEHTNWAAAQQYGGGIMYSFGKTPFSLDFSAMHVDTGEARSAAQMDVNSSSEEQLISPAAVKLRGSRWNVGLHYKF